jgi:chromosome segregation ATPase
LRVAPAAEAAAEIERLRRQLGEREKVIAARDDEIRRLREEIERIRKTLVPQRP